MVMVMVMVISDEPMKTKVLLHLFDYLKEQGQISGGMLSGAMGGGVAMYVSISVLQLPSPSPSQSPFAIAITVFVGLY